MAVELLVRGLAGVGVFLAGAMAASLVWPGVLRSPAARGVVAGLCAGVALATALGGAA